MPLGASRLLTLANPGVAAGPEQRTSYTVTAYGNAQISRQEARYGDASGKFDGADDYLLAPIDQSFWSNSFLGVDGYPVNLRFTEEKKGIERLSITYFVDCCTFLLFSVLSLRALCAL